MLIKTKTLEGSALDWAVAKSEGLATSMRATEWREKNHPHNYASNRELGGAILEKEGISVMRCVGVYSSHEAERSVLWAATSGKQFLTKSNQHSLTDPTVQTDEAMYQIYESEVTYGPTLLLAGMRCYVLSKLGEQVDIPKELLADHLEIDGQGKFRFNLPVGNNDSLWFIGSGQFDEDTSKFTGDLTLDFLHHWGSNFKDHLPGKRYEAGYDDSVAWFCCENGHTAGAVAIPVSNVSRLDLDVEVASGFAENTALTSDELRPDIVRNEDHQVRPRG